MAQEFFFEMAGRSWWLGIGIVEVQAELWDIRIRLSHPSV
jgi:hypothetical protein